jgi:hypothetical protein
MNANQEVQEDEEEEKQEYPLEEDEEEEKQEYPLEEDEEEEKQEYPLEEDKKRNEILKEDKLWNGKSPFIKIEDRSNGDIFTITPNE